MASSGILPNGTMVKLKIDYSTMNQERINKLVK